MPPGLRLQCILHLSPVNYHPVFDVSLLRKGATFDVASTLLYSHPLPPCLRFWAFAQPFRRAWVS